EGPRGYSRDELDEAFTIRDLSWDRRTEIETRLRDAMIALNNILHSSPAAAELTNSRLRNQADFYSLIGAVDALIVEGILPNAQTAAERLLRFVERVDDEGTRRDDPDLLGYFDAARSASNDKGPRETRINYLKQVLTTAAPA